MGSRVLFGLGPSGFVPMKGSFFAVIHATGRFVRSVIRENRFESVWTERAGAGLYLYVYDACRAHRTLLSPVVNTVRTSAAMQWSRISALAPTAKADEQLRKMTPFGNS